MSDVRTTLTIYSDTLTEDELATLLGPDWMSEDVYELDWGLPVHVDTAPRRYLYWQGDHHGWLNEEEKIAELLELRSDITEIEWRQEDRDANYDDVISAEVWTRDGVRKFGTVLVPHGLAEMLAEVRMNRRNGNEHNAWLAAERLFAALEKGMSL